MLWIFQSLLVAHFHEPWRDEAQAWLVARSSHSLAQLLYNSSLEVTGPLYYLLLWPWAQKFPGAFPAAIFWISWLGTLGAVAWLFFSRLFPFGVALLVGFGYLYGYEFAVIARLYGWASFFFLGGLWFDHRARRGWAQVFWAAACFTHLTFVFPVGGWCFYRIFQRPKLREKWSLAWRFLPLVAVVILVVLHLEMAAAERVWTGWRWVARASQMGSSLGTGFLQSPGKIGWGGFLVFALALWALASRGKLLAFLLGVLPYFVLFSFRAGSDGVASSRHAAGIFLLWLALAFTRPAKARLAWFLPIFALSLLTGLVARYQDLRANYSEGQLVAEIIRHEAQGRPVHLFAQDFLYGMVPAAVLNTNVTSNFDFVTIDHPQLTRAMVERRERELGRLPWDEYQKHCRFAEEFCFVISRPQNEKPPVELRDDFRLLHAGGPTISDESLDLYEVLPLR